jgi:hypothetical protein
MFAGAMMSVAGAITSDGCCCKWIVMAGAVSTDGWCYV